jgi:hypothetical protein
MLAPPPTFEHPTAAILENDFAAPLCQRKRALTLRRDVASPEATGVALGLAASSWKAMLAGHLKALLVNCFGTFCEPELCRQYRSQAITYLVVGR